MSATVVRGDDRVVDVDRLTGLTVAALFAGIGGIELGLHGAGHRTAAWCQADPGAAAVLRSRFEVGENLHADVADMDELGYDVEWVTAGFPCQDLSQAGRTAASRAALRTGRTRIPTAGGPPRATSAVAVAGERPVHAVPRRWGGDAPADRRARRARLLVGLPRGRHPGLRTAPAPPPGPSAGVHDRRPPGHRARPRRRTVASRGSRRTGVRLLLDRGHPRSRAGGRQRPHAQGRLDDRDPSPPAIWIRGEGLFTPDLRDAERLQGFPADWTAPAEGEGRRAERAGSSSATPSASPWPNGWAAASACPPSTATRWT